MRRKHRLVSNLHVLMTPQTSSKLRMSHCIQSTEHRGRTSTENLLDASRSTSTGEIMAGDPTLQKIVEEKDKVQLQDVIQAASKDIHSSWTRISK
ncbi:hypothetical protein TNCT_100181 [Trichonephila clavata]|uniref:Uncharacterized protein n=1 Tax=Trichonephila clavata TaxID=2740835 RepID=A0A8X6FMY5_TRICU|nr:hypothetical protein TNCT_100181 [Trichonephila clavata]